MNIYRERINALREQMRMHDMDAYIIVTDDFHGSEYVGEYFKARAYVSGFTGSAGTLVVLDDQAALWTDGRYFIQAQKQLEGSTITLMKSGEAGVPAIGEFLAQNLSQGANIGFDGRTMTCKFVDQIFESIDGLEMNFCGETDLVDIIWENRPELSKEMVWSVTDYAGETRESKIKRVREKMKEVTAQVYLVSALDEIAWLLNLRGNDVACTPVFLSYLIIGKEFLYLYVNEEILREEIREQLELCGIEIREYNKIYRDIKIISKDKMVLLDGDSTNYAMITSMDDNAMIIDEISPIKLLKAVKNKVECKNAVDIHVKDGVAVTKFMYWLKTNIGKIPMDEIMVAEKLEEFRRLHNDYIGPSFEPIMAYGEHGAIVHYSATKETNQELKAEGFLLSDTGGHYLGGTTDCTRTYALGKLTDEERRDYTLVLMGNLRLAAAKYKSGIRGINLDILAREPLWEYGLDYNHGTGHGVGNVLNVHEGPNSFRWQTIAGGKDSAVLEEGMITSNEPGIYITGKFGVRLENLILCEKEKTTEYGQFMHFKTLTMIPFDLEAVDITYMTNNDIELLNAYHKEVYHTLKDYLTEEEREWLEQATREL